MQKKKNKMAYSSNEDISDDTRNSKNLQKIMGKKI